MQPKQQTDDAEDLGAIAASTERIRELRARRPVPAELDTAWDRDVDAHVEEATERLRSPLETLGLFSRYTLIGGGPQTIESLTDALRRLPRVLDRTLLGPFLITARPRLREFVVRNRKQDPNAMATADREAEIAKEQAGIAAGWQRIVGRRDADTLHLVPPGAAASAYARDVPVELLVAGLDES